MKCSEYNYKHVKYILCFALFVSVGDYSGLLMVLPDGQLSIKRHESQGRLFACNILILMRYACTPRSMRNNIILEFVQYVTEVKK